MKNKFSAFIKKIKFCWWVLTNNEYQANNEPTETQEKVPNVTKIITDFKRSGLLIDNLDKDNALAKKYPADKIFLLADKEGKEYAFFECKGVTQSLNNHEEVNRLIAQVFTKQNDTANNNTQLLQR